jgi:hypothetical protein
MFGVAKKAQAQDEHSTTPNDITVIQKIALMTVRFQCEVQACLINESQFQ